MLSVPVVTGNFAAVAKLELENQELSPRVIQCFSPHEVDGEVSCWILFVSGIRAVDPRIDGTDPLSMADGTMSMDMRRELDGLKEQVKDQLKANSDEMKKSIEELRTMIASVAASVRELHGGLIGETSTREGMREEPDTIPPTSLRQDHWHQTYQAPTWFSQIKFPKFNREDLRGWIYRCKQFLEEDDTRPQSKVRIAVVHLEGKALQWHQIFMKNQLTRDLPHWGEYVKAFNDRFGALLYEDPMSELASESQTN
ncbi:hypothetical protein BUALT_Bualt15G0085700 [Buddleja alternifolia]|uniref:Retrotransposon gag domain-containing protein n=1 Tax=Buddleja alternifolia TaxID=168488 RepID=A0AAV6WKB1_9LAMI|nr:hypothetical protein BUALT_Bualt15G0085700 [Buddleja alternifolia]